MAKRSNNNSAGRRIYGEKPYDANNSFVKKMATKVTDLIPQRSWISKWFNSPGGNGEVTNDGDNPDDQDVEEETLQPPSKRPRIRMDTTHPPGTFNIQTRGGREVDNEKLEYTNDQYPDDTMTDFLQPSLNSARNSNTGRPFAASTPAIRVPTRTSLRTNLNSINHQQQQQQQQQSQQQQQQQNNVATNGVDDNSESSESTSGCSSLIPQTNRQEGLSQYINYPFAVKKGLSNDKLSFTNHLQSPKSLSFDGRDSASSRRPSFNYSIVSNGSSSVLSSPFYSGNTTFGGANAITSFRSVGAVGTANDANNEFQLRVPKRTSIRVKPSNSSATSDSSGMSQTAKRILEALEHFSSPLSDAKKIPIKTPLTAITSSKKRPREEDDLPNVSNVGLRHLTRELSVPTVPDMLKLKRRQRLQDTTLAVRRIVTAQNEQQQQQQQQQQPPTSSASSSNVPTSTNSTEYHLRTESEDKKFFGKLRAKAKKKVDVEEPADTVNLSNIPLPITTLPNFNIPLPVPQYKANDEPKKSTTKEETAAFKFSSPLKVTTDTGKKIVATSNYKFSEPIDPERKTEVENSTSASSKSSPSSSKFKYTFNSVNCSPATNFMWSGSSTAPRPKEKKVEIKKEEKSDGVSVASELKSGSVMDILGKKKNADLSSGNVWECSECIIKNHESSDQCIACKARKSDTNKKQLASNSVNDGQFGAQFKMTNDKWECSSCLVRNPVSQTKCLSCMTARQKIKNENEKSLSSAKATTKSSPASGFKMIIKSQKNTWECPGCMLKNADNVITCPCCNASKPGMIKSSWKPSVEDKTTDNSTKPWECPSCMVKNKSTDSACVCCTTPCPNGKNSATEAAPKPAATTAAPIGFGDKFKKPTGNWTCDTCLVSNKADVTKCAACETPKPGADSADKKTTETAASKMQFSFGTQPPSEFKFGIPKTAATEDKKKPENAANGFTFGVVPSNPQPATQGFTFGIPKTETTSATSGFTFAVPKSSTTEMSKSNAQEGSSSAVSHGFTFGVPKKPDVKIEEDKKPPVITFGVPKTENESKPAVQPIVFSNPIATNAGNNPTSIAQQQNSATEAKKPAVFSFVPPGSVTTGAVVSSQSSSVVSSSTGQTPFTFSEPKTSSIAESSEKRTINFGQGATCGLQIPLPEPAEKKPAFNFGSAAPAAPITFGVAPAAENKTANKPAASPFGIANNQEKTGFTIEKKVPAFGVEVKPTETPASVFGNSEKPPLFNAAASSGLGAKIAPTPTPMFGAGTNVFAGNNTTGFGQPAVTTPNIFSAVKPAETTTAPAPGIFSFGGASTAAAAAQPAQVLPSANTGFQFNINSPAQKTPFMFAGSAPAAATPAAQPTATAVPAVGTGFGAPVNFGAANATTATPTPFTFNAPKAEGSSAFEQAPATQLPSIFSNNQSSTALGQQATPAASFTSSTPGSTALFSFGTPTPGTGTSSGTASSGFNFNAGITPATPAPGGFNFNVGSNTTTPVSFDPNTKPSFNFTGGSAPTAFNAQPQPARKIKRAVRRMHPNRT